MIAEILATGDEIRSGALVDSNSAYISQKIEEVGVEVSRHISVGDDLDILASTFKEISNRAQIAVVTGGLGPTSDDLSAQAAASAMGVELVLDEEALKSMEAFFIKRNLPMGVSNKKQAFLPVGSRIIHNPLGTAPGFYIKINKCSFFFLPGVPFEMKTMLKNTVLLKINELLGDNRQTCIVKTISTFGITESAAGERLAGLTDLFPDIKLGFRSKFPVIQIKLYLYGKDEEKLNTKMKAVEPYVLEKFGKKVFSVNDTSLEAVVGELLRSKGLTLAIAESCTGGLVSHLITNQPGSSDYFLFSGVTYSNKSKINLLGVSEKTLEKYGAVHEETAKEMAQGARRIAGASHGIATTGIAGPGGGTEDKPVGTICIGMATPDGVKGYTYNFPFPKRSMNKIIFAMKAIDLLRLELQKAL